MPRSLEVRRTTIDVRRHSLTAKHEDDFRRELTPEGRDLAKSVCLANGRGYDIVLFSPAPRALDTAVLLAGSSFQLGMRIPELYPVKDTADGAVIWKLFDELQMSPLSHYYQHPRGGAMREYGNKAWLAIDKALRSIEPIVYKASPSVLVVGHALCLNTMGHGAIGLNTHDHEKEIKYFNLNSSLKRNNSL